VEPDELISRIKSDHKIQKEVEEPLPAFNIFKTGAAGGGKSTMGVNGEFVFSQVLIDCLLRLTTTETDKNELIKICEGQYKNIPSELDYIREFNKDYSPDKALWWYTNDSFFYKTLNAALRTQNIHMIFLFRAYISDIYCQLKNYQSKDLLQVYRGQKISSDELENLRKGLGQFISINSFFSTSMDREQALSFAKYNDISDGSKRVLFQIDIDPKIVNTKPFADISKYSAFRKEAEVLFMLGSIFRLQRIDPDDDQVWIIQMSLCSDDEHDLKEVLMYMKQQIGSGETNLRILGKLLEQMGKVELAEKYFNRLLKELQPNDPLIGNLYDDLGKLASQRLEYDISIEWYKKSLQFKNKYGGKFIIRKSIAFYLISYIKKFLFELLIQHKKKT